MNQITSTDTDVDEVGLFKPLSNELTAMIEQVAPEVAQHCDNTSLNEAHHLLRLPFIHYQGRPLISQKNEVKAVLQMADDLISGNPQAMAIKEAQENIKVREAKFSDVLEKEHARIAQEKGYGSVPFDYLYDPAQDGDYVSIGREELERRDSQRSSEIFSLVEQTEVYRLAVGDRFLAYQQEWSTLTAWVNLYWPSGTGSTAKMNTLPLPVRLPHPTFIEARRVCECLSDGRDGRNWAPIEGVIALLHSAPRATHSVRFEPSSRLLNWWGTSGVQLENLRAELKLLSLDDVILFRVVLSAILHNDKARFSASLDDIITLIGRDKDARRSSSEREKWRAKVWRSIVLFDSLSVIGTRGGKWREPGAKGEKRALMEVKDLYTRDPLLLISGTRDTEQGTFDGSAPPKAVSLVPGDWLMEFHGNREVLSEFGDVLSIVHIPRGKPSGAWAAFLLII